MDQRTIAERISSSQAMISRAERAEKLLPLPKVLAWAEACGADDDMLNRLAALVEAAFTQTEAWRDLLPATPLQDSVRANEATAHTLLNYSPTVIPGLIQTPGYAEHVLRLTNYTREMDESAALAGRWRRQEALADRSRHFEFVIPEAVLRWSPAGSEVLLAQLERLTVVAGQDNVLLGVVAAGREPVLPFHGFVIYADRDADDPFVAVEAVHTYITAHSPADVALYQQVFDKLRSAALIGADAVSLIQRVAVSLRR